MSDWSQPNNNCYYVNDLDTSSWCVEIDICFSRIVYHLYCSGDMCVCYPQDVELSEDCSVSISNNKYSQQTKT